MERIDDNKRYYSYFREKEEIVEKKLDKNSIEEALKIALDTRKFEIELYWKRANYFWLFIASIFVGYYSTLKTNDPLNFENIAIALLGYITSVCWLCVNRGSKFWQENWERNIELLSRKMGYPIFGLIACGKYSATDFKSKYPYSVSKVNQFVNCIVVLFWTIIVIYRSMNLTTTNCNCAKYLCVLIALLILIVLFVFIHWFSKSFVTSRKKELGDSTVLFYNYDE